MIGVRIRCSTALLAMVVLAAGCGAGASAVAPSGGELVVHAAASLTDAFSDIRQAFNAEHPDVPVTYNFAGSQRLAQQLTQGAPGDVFASADQRQMDVVADAGLLAGEPQPFIANVLQIAVEPGNPLDIRALVDLARPDVTVVLAAEEVPAGQYTKQALDGAGVQVQPASLENDVRAVLQRVSLGEADAGIVYASDVASADGEVDGVAIPEDHNVPATYPIATLADAPNAEAAEAFVEFVLSDEGQAILVGHGFAELP
jgi:molybdate transport system substrate-binding protein